MAEANSLLIRWAHSRNSSRSSGGDRVDDATSINWLMFHLTEVTNTAYKKGHSGCLKALRYCHHVTRTRQRAEAKLPVHVDCASCTHWFCMPEQLALHRTL